MGRQLILVIDLSIAAILEAVLEVMRGFKLIGASEFDAADRAFALRNKLAAITRPEKE